MAGQRKYGTAELWNCGTLGLRRCGSIELNGGAAELWNFGIGTADLRYGEAAELRNSETEVLWNFAVLELFERWNDGIAEPWDYMEQGACRTVNPWGSGIAELRNRGT